MKSMIDPLLMSVYERVLRISINHLGLYNGTGGRAMLTYHFAELFQREDLYEQADELIVSLTKNIANIKSENLANGIFGIGWVLDYLSKNEFISAGENLFSFFDNIFINYNRFSEDLKIDTGTLGYCAYVTARLIPQISEWQKADLSLKQLEIMKSVIQLLDQLDNNIDLLYNEYEITTDTDLKKFLKADPKFLHAFIVPLCSAYIMLCSISKTSIYTEVVNRRIEQLGATLANTRYLIENVTLLSYLEMHKFYYPLLILLIDNALCLNGSVNSMRAFREDEFNSNIICNPNIPNTDIIITIQTLVRSFHICKNQKYADTALYLATIALDKGRMQNRFDASIDKGYAGICLSLIALSDSSVLNWDTAIGLS